MVVNVAKVAPGREQEYLDVMTTDFLPHFDEDEVHHVSGSLAFGGDGGFIHVFYVENFAELDKGSPVMRALGAEGALSSDRQANRDRDQQRALDRPCPSRTELRPDVQRTRAVSCKLALIT